MSTILSMSNDKKYISSEIKARQVSRILAVQCIYAATIYRDYDNIKTLVQRIAESQIKDNIFVEEYKNYDKKYLLELVTGTIQELPSINSLLDPLLAEGWSIHRLGQVVKCILWLGSWELLHQKQLSSAIIINEYINIAKLFSHEGEAGFINNVLDQVAQL